MSDKLYPRVKIQVKASKYYSLNKEEKRHDKILASVRVPIKHFNWKYKIFQINAELYRGKYKNYEKTLLLQLPTAQAFQPTSQGFLPLNLFRKEF